MTSLRSILAEAGFHGSGLDTAVAVAMAESGGRPMAHNGNAGTGDNSYGLFQINMLGKMGRERLAEYNLSSYEDLYDPHVNAQIAYKLSKGGTNWGPWTTYTRGTYRHYLNEDPPLGGTGHLGAAGGDYGSKGDDHGSNDGTDSHSSNGLDPGTGHSTLGQNTAGHGTNFDIGPGSPLSALMPSHDEMAAQVADLLGLPAPTPTTSSSPTTTTGESNALHTFLSAAVAQRGDKWVFGAKGDGQSNPTQFDCSGLTKWAAHQAGVTLPDGAGYQYQALKKQGMLIPVDQAINTPGALLFHFAHEPRPGEGEPRVAHVAISLGNGRTIEAANPHDGVNEFSAKGRFDYAAVIPGISAPEPGTSTSHLFDGMGSNSTGVNDSGLFSVDSDFDGGVPTAAHHHSLGTSLGASHAAPTADFDNDDISHHGIDFGLH